MEKYVAALSDDAPLNDVQEQLVSISIKEENSDLISNCHNMAILNGYDTKFGSINLSLIYGLSHSNRFVDKYKNYHN